MDNILVCKASEAAKPAGDSLTNEASSYLSEDRSLCGIGGVLSGAVAAGGGDWRPFVKILNAKLLRRAPNMFFKGIGPDGVDLACVDC